MMHKPTPEQIAFFEEVKSILDRHQPLIGEMAMVALLSQLAGNIAALPMVYDHMSAVQMLEIINENARNGMTVGLTALEEIHKEAQRGTTGQD